MKNCTNCGTELQDNAKFCHDCGTKQPEPKKYCTECGEELKPNAKFCSECGTPVEPGKDPSQLSRKVDPKPAKKEDEESEGPAPLSPKMKKYIKEGGVLVYEDEDHDYIEDNVMPYLYETIGETEESLENWVEELSKDFDPDEMLLWDTFGQPAKDVEEYGEPEDEYDRDLRYTIIDDTLLIVGEGNTFRILSDKDKKKASNYWVLNDEIIEKKDQIKRLFVIGENTSIRARLFKELTNLEYAALSEGVIGVRLEAFAGCPLKFMYIPETIEHLVEKSYVDSKFTFMFFPPFTSDPDDRSIQEDIFVNCKNLKYFIVPRSFEELYDLSLLFQNCPNLDTERILDFNDLR